MIRFGDEIEKSILELTYHFPDKLCLVEGKRKWF